MEYSVHEVHYGEEGELLYYTANCVDMSGETYEDVQGDYKLVAEAFNKPILERGDFKKYG